LILERSQLKINQESMIKMINHWQIESIMRMKVTI